MIYNTSRVKIALDDFAFPPVRAHDADAGLDLRSPLDLVLEPGVAVTINTGVHIEIPFGFAGLLVSKSGLNTKHSITSTGLIDAGYSGSIAVKLYNHGKDEYVVKRGDKISQLIITPVVIPELVLVQLKDFSDSERKDSGFGSSGR